MNSSMLFLWTKCHVLGCRCPKSCFRGSSSCPVFSSGRKLGSILRTCAALLCALMAPRRWLQLWTSVPHPSLSLVSLIVFSILWMSLLVSWIVARFGNIWNANLRLYLVFSVRGAISLRIGPTKWAVCPHRANRSSRYLRPSPRSDPLWRSAFP